MNQDSDAQGAAAFPARKVIAWILVVLWAAFIFYMSSRTSNSLEYGSDSIGLVFQWVMALQDKLLPSGIDLASAIAHTGEYLVLGALLAHALRFYLPKNKAFALAWACCMVFALSDEFHQLFFSEGRAWQFRDLLCDCIGSGLGSFLLSRLCKGNSFKGQSHA